MSENTPNDPFAAPPGYAGAGKRARRVEPDSESLAEPVSQADADGESTPVPDADQVGVWGQDPRPVVEEGLADEREMWNDIFSRSGSDPSLTATGSIPVVDAAAVALPPRAPAPVPAPTTEVPYDPFADSGAWSRGGEQAEGPGEQTRSAFPPVTVEGQGLAEYTVEVPVVSPRGVAPRVRSEAEGNPSAPAKVTPLPPVPWESAAETTMQISPHQLPSVTNAVPSQEQPVPLDPADQHPQPEPVEPEPVEPAATADEPAAQQQPGHVTPAYEPMYEDLFRVAAPQEEAEPVAVPAHEDPEAEPFLPVRPGRRRAHRAEPAEHPDAHDDHDDHDGDEGGRSRVTGCLLVLVILALVGGGLYLAVDKGMGWVRDQFSSAEDFGGPGSGTVHFEIKAGETGNQIARNLKAAGVVASVQAYIDAAATAGSEKTNLIQAGTYTLAKEMRAADVVNALIDPANRSLSRVTVPEGLRAVDIVDVIAAKTDLKKSALSKALNNGEALGLPAYANGNPEGFLFPATYEVAPNETAASMLKKMVDRWHQADSEWKLEEHAATLGITPYELMTVASLVQAEGRGKDMNKIARVIYNRLENPTGPSAGFLGIDAAINYGLDQKGVVALTSEQLQIDTPYNTRLNKGLPPTPINNMGDEAMEAAANPAKGPWEWYVTVNLKTGETKFTDSYEEFGRFKNEYLTYCATSDAC